MIKYSITKETKGFVENYTLHEEGHAGYAEEGKDIVCSAVSAMLITLAQVIENMALTECNGEVFTELLPGKVYIYCQCARGNQKVRDAFEFVNVGLRMIAEQYPDYVQRDESM